MKNNPTNFKTAVAQKWDLKHLYSSEKDLEKDLVDIEKEYRRFEKKFKKNDYYKTDVDQFLISLFQYFSIHTLTLRAYEYIYLTNDAFSSPQSEKLSSKISSKLADIENIITFYIVEISHLPTHFQKEILRNPESKKYAKLLKNLWKESKHILSEKEEKVLNKKHLTSNELWSQGVTKQQNLSEIVYKNKTISLTEAIELLDEISSAPERKKLWKSIIVELKKIAPFSEYEINAIIKDKESNDQLRNFQNADDDTLLSFENSREEVDALVSAVENDYKNSHAFYNFQAEFLNIEKPEYVDRNAPFPELDIQFSFENSSEILQNIYKNLGQKYVDFHSSMLKENRIDVFPRKGKSGGAYCMGGRGLPTYVLLNHLPNVKSFMTYSHEMGHAFHSMMSNEQPTWYRGYSTSVAEVASTLFESISADYIIPTLSKKDQVYFLAKRVADSYKTIHRQIAFYSFERELHAKIRSEGFVSHEGIAELLSVHMRKYLGNKYLCSIEDGYQFISWSHLRSYFYTYSYAYGDLISNVLYARYKADPSYWMKIESFLSAGSSKTPHDIFKAIGIDTFDPQVWKEGLAEIKSQALLLKKLIKEIK